MKGDETADEEIHVERLCFVSLSMESTKLDERQVRVVRNYVENRLGCPGQLTHEGDGVYSLNGGSMAVISKWELGVTAQRLSRRCPALCLEWYCIDEV